MRHSPLLDCHPREGLDAPLEPDIPPTVVEGRLVVTGYGARATAARGALVEEAKAGEVLAPVDVVVPSAFAGMTVRRPLAGDRGVVNVRFSSLLQLRPHEVAHAKALPVLVEDSTRLPPRCVPRRRGLPRGSPGLHR